MSEDLSRRKALSLLGLGAVLGFTLSAALEPSEAEAQQATGTAPAAPAEATGTHGMQRRQGRRTHRHERRHGRHERRHERRTGEKPEATPPAGTAPAPQIGSQPLAGSHAPRLGVSAGLEPKRRLTTRGLIARQGRKQGVLAPTIASQHGNASPHKWGCGAPRQAQAPVRIANGHGGKAQKIGQKKQARSLVRPHIDGASLRIARGRSPSPRRTQAARAREDYRRGRVLAARSRRLPAGNGRQTRTDRTPMKSKNRAFVRR